MVTAYPEHAALEAWSGVLARARAELPDTTLVMWFSDVRPAGLVDDVLTLAVPSPLVRERLQHNHLALIEEAVAASYGGPVKIEFEVEEGIRHPLDETPVADATPAAPASHTPIGEPSEAVRRRATAVSLGAPGLPFPNYTFEAFVPGPSNRFAHAAAMAVAEAPPSTAYNPLFIYGGVGLGKTHLLIAVGHHMYRVNPGIRVKYVTSERFVTEFIKAVRERQGDQFRHRYREVDVLLVDDIQFLAKREETQTEFFHTFNHLHGSGRQIAIASDRPPHELSGLEERLVSRFRWGLCVDVQPPDLETRIAILQLKAERERLTIPARRDRVRASKFDQSVRELEGSGGSSPGQTHRAIDRPGAGRARPAGLIPADHEIPPQLIMEQTAEYFSLSTGDLVSKSRSRPLTQARHIAMYLMRECTGLSLVKIGEIFGGRDHTTVLHGIKKVEDEMRERDATFRQVQDLTRIVRGRVRGTS
jgi:chromosomal replication initiator protein